MSLVVEKDNQVGDVSLHPLVIINISDHYTRRRVKSNGKEKNPRVIGALMGQQNGRNVEIFNSFALLSSVEDGKLVIDPAYLIEKKDLFAECYPTYDILGWYSTCAGVTREDFAVNAQLADVNESPLLLILDPVKAVPTAKELPISIYEQEIKVVDGAPKQSFSKLKFKIESGESERVAVDHIARVKPVAEGDSVLAGHLEGVGNAIQMLNLRVKGIQRFIDATIDGKVPKDHNLLRQVSAMTNMLPAIDSEAFREEFLVEYNDTLLVTYLAAITKGAQQASELVEKFNAAHDKHSRRRGAW